MTKDPFAEEPTTKRSNKDSNICALLKGDENTLKTGIAMDCRSESQIAAHEKIYVIDPMGTTFPIWNGHWGGSDDIIIHRPIERNIVALDGGKRKKEIDFEGTFDNIYSTIIDIEEAIEGGEIVAGVIFEGLDSLRQDAANAMREHVDLEVDDGVNFKYWNLRNKYYDDVIRAMIELPCPKYFTTHLKEHKVRSATKKDDKGEALITSAFVDADMGLKTKDAMLQIIECSKSKSPDGIITYNAHIEEFKSKPEFEGKDFTTMITGSGEFTYYGLGILRDDANVENRQLDALF
jgi:hypothetical protein